MSRFGSTFFVGLGLWLGLRAQVHFLALLWDFSPLFLQGFEGVSLIGLLALLLKKMTFFETPDRDNASPSLYFLVSLLAVVAITYFAAQSLTFPHGEGDAFAIWNLRARFLYYGDAEWMIAFSPVLEFSHTDYPLLIPLSVTRGWVILGQETPLVSVALAFFYTSGVVYLLFLVLQKASFKAGLVAVSLLLAQPSYVRMGASQMADIPLAFYILLSVTLLQRCKNCSAWTMVLVGLSVGCALWTKNEGALFTLVFGTGLLAQRIGIYRFAAWILGLLPALVSYLLLKDIVPTPNDLIAGQGMETFHRLMDVSRYLQIGAAYLLEGWAILMTLGGIALWAFAHRPQVHPPGHAFLLWLIASMLVGYFLVFLTTPAPLDWHLDTALDRLLMQITPLILFYAGLWLGQVYGRQDTLLRDEEHKS